MEFVAGSGASPDVLRRGGVERCAALIAATRLDEVTDAGVFVGGRIELLEYRSGCGR